MDGGIAVLKCPALIARLAWISIRGARPGSERSTRQKGQRWVRIADATRIQDSKQLFALAAIGRAAALAAGLTALVLAAGRAATSRLSLRLRGLGERREGENETHG